MREISEGSPLAEIQIQIYEGSRVSLLPLFRMADESESEVLASYEMGSVLVARERGSVVGLAHVVEEADTLEIVNLAVVPRASGSGIGKRLIEEAARFSRLSNTRRLVVCTGAWETGNIIFYLKRGFRIFNVVQNFFTSDKGYDLAVRDQVQFEMGCRRIGWDRSQASGRESAAKIDAGAAVDYRLRPCAAVR